MEFRELPLGACFFTVPGSYAPGTHLVKVGLDRYMVGGELREGISLHQQVLRTYPPLERPLTAREVKERRDGDGLIRAVIAVDLSDLVDRDLDGLNELADELVLPRADDPDYDDVSLCLSGVSYRVVGAVEGPTREGDEGGDYLKGRVLIEVEGFVEVFDREARPGEGDDG